MKANFNIDAGMPDNASEFSGEFFSRFNLRHADAPLELQDGISKNYLFPTLYANVRCAIGIFMCGYKNAKKLMPHPRVKPVKMTFDRSLVIFSCYEYRTVMNVAPYNEIAMTIPVMVDPVVNVPVLPMISDAFKEFGYYVFHMPVTSYENQLRGNRIWGLPKVTREIDIFEEGGDCVTIAREESGEPYFTLRVPMKGDPEKYDVCSNLYTRLDDKLLQSRTCFQGTFAVSKFMKLLLLKGIPADRTYLEIGDSDSASQIRDLDIEPHPFQLRYIDGMSSSFDLPNPGYRSKLKFRGI